MEYTASEKKTAPANYCNSIMVRSSARQYRPAIVAGDGTGAAALPEAGSADLRRALACAGRG
jgi:hypothetical protein